MVAFNKFLKWREMTPINVSDGKNIESHSKNLFKIEFNVKLWVQLWVFVGIRRVEIDQKRIKSTALIFGPKLRGSWSWKRQLDLGR